MHCSSQGSGPGPSSTAVRGPKPHAVGHSLLPSVHSVKLFAYLPMLAPSLQAMVPAVEVVAPVSAVQRAPGGEVRHGRGA